ncbi:MAG TPA: hypothetical protein VFI02_19395 [Armatimonadota bacterium]|nr:hypothetical protein [Armatimonadota bacterium]
MCKLACRMVVCLLLLSVVALAAPIQVTIDILPGESPNVIGLGAWGSLRVAILTTDGFKAATVDSATLELDGVAICLGGKQQSPVCSREDVDGDHDKDLVAEFPLERFSLADGERTLVLTGRMKNGKEFAGSDSLICMAVSPPSVAAAMAGKSPDISPGLCDGGVLVCWDDFIVQSSANIIEYLVYRVEDTCIYGENWASCVIPFGSRYWVEPVLCMSPIDAPPYAGPAGSFDHSAIDDELPRSVDRFCPGQGDSWVFCGFTAPGVKTGEDYHYRVTCMYSLSLEIGELVYRESRPVYAGHATYLARPLPVNPASSAVIDLSNVTFEWQGSAMAFGYCIEVSPSPSFERANTWVTEIYQITKADGDLVSRTFTNILNNAPELASVTPGSTLYWRVGARNTWDSPGAYPAGPSPLAEGEKNTRYIYSQDLFAFMTLPDMPGPPPDDGGDDDGGDVPPPPPF